ncbi:MAG: SpoIIE family protein phosphatase [Candidatus Omnitrophica bacterium]|nr:SpoIIE family protein phosphatase [Candidatus Omnitrophota bacterium]
MAEQPTLLIVDDEEEIRENLSDFAEFKGFTVLQACNGRQALDLLKDHQPDLIISDLMMPEMGGMQLLQELNQRSSDVPVVIMTAFGTMEYAIDAMKNGAADFLTKPIDLPYMLKVVDKILQRSAMQQKIKEQQMQLEEDLRHAASIQRCLLPAPVENEYLSIHFRYEPLIAIGGDYLTIHQFSSREVGIALYDVSGHGVSAALTANLIHYQLQQRLSELRPPSNVANLLNRFITENIEKTSMFITMAIVAIDLEEGIMTITNAGHPDLYLWRSRLESLEAVSSHILPVGITPKILGDNNETIVHVESGDRLILYTDGFLEALDQEGNMLGKEGLQEMILRHCRYRPTDFLQKMFDDLNRFQSGEPEDDLTLMVIDIK